MKIHVIITMIALVVFLIAAIWYAKKKYKINLSVLGLGAVAFFGASSTKRRNHFAHAGAPFFICPLGNCYGSYL